MDRRLVEAAVLDAARLVLPDLADAITPADSLTALGANSIDRVEVAVTAMETLGISVPPGALKGIVTLDQLIDILAAHDPD